MTKEKRSDRKTLSKRMPRIGRVVFSEDIEAVHCTVRDFSPSGAVISMSGWLGLPSGFTLYVEPDSVRAQCQVVSRKGNNIRVAFDEIEDDVRFRPANRPSVASGAMI